MLLFILKINTKVCRVCMTEKHKTLFYAGKGSCIDCFKNKQNERRMEAEILKMERINYDMENHMIATDVNQEAKTLKELNLNIIKNTKYLVELDKFMVKFFTNTHHMLLALMDNIRTYDEWSIRIENFFTGRVVPRDLFLPDIGEIIPLSKIPRLDTNYSADTGKIKDDINLALVNDKILLAENEELKSKISKLEDKINSSTKVNELDNVANELLNKRIEEFDNKHGTDIIIIKEYLSDLVDSFTTIMIDTKIRNNGKILNLDDKIKELNIKNMELEEKNNNLENTLKKFEYELYNCRVQIDSILPKLNSINSTKTPKNSNNLETTQLSQDLIVNR